MKDLNYQLSKLCRDNRDGGFSTQATRSRLLDLIANQLQELGYRRMQSTSLKPKHIDALLAHWREQGISVGTLKNRCSIRFAPASTASSCKTAPDRGPFCPPSGRVSPSHPHSGANSSARRNFRWTPGRAAGRSSATPLNPCRDSSRPTRKSRFGIFQYSIASVRIGPLDSREGTLRIRDDHR